jgi:hypothetical protein
VGLVDQDEDPPEGGQARREGLGEDVRLAVPLAPDLAERDDRPVRLAGEGLQDEGLAGAVGADDRDPSRRAIRVVEVAEAEPTRG